MAIPLFNFEHEVSAAEAKHDKLEILIEGLFLGNAEEASILVDYLGPPRTTAGRLFLDGDAESNSESSARFRFPGECCGLEL